MAINESVDSVLVAPPDTRHRSLLNTNEVPQDSDITYVKSVVSKIRLRLAHVDNEILRLRDQLKAMEEERTLLSLSLAQNSAILSPLRRMPPEVLCEIFSWTLPTTIEAVVRGRLDVTDSPWVLGYICSRWRAIALSFPSLWALVAIDYSQLDCPPSTAYPLAMLKIQMQRARELKIHFLANPESYLDAQKEIFEFLIERSLCWVDLNLSITPDLLPLLSNIRHRIPLLRRVWITYDSTEREEITLFQSAPSLRDLGLQKCLSEPIPAHQLTRYEMHGTREEHLRILRLASNLIEAIVLIADDSLRVASVKAIELLHLRRLYVTSADVTDLLTLPALEELAFDSDEDHSLDHIESLLLRSACTLRRLCIRGCLDSPATAKILHTCPSIVELAIITFNDDDAAAANTLISHLTIHNPGEVVAPHLRGIFFGSDDDSCIDYTLYLKMLHSRWESQRCGFKCAGLCIASEALPPPEVISSIDSLCRDGLDWSYFGEGEARLTMRGWCFLATWMWN
ncbi:hypothetical protein C8R44DRAFT_984599 [Mycena epipterygia]|nr:hypothetical protein C8R44DRAFT_984599 [Mycena epipterygia]